MWIVQSKEEVLTANILYLFTEAISPSLNQNLVFVAGCVVAVVAMDVWNDGLQIQGIKGQLPTS